MDQYYWWYNLLVQIVVLYGEYFLMPLIMGYEIGSPNGCTLGPPDGLEVLVRDEVCFVEHEDVRPGPAHHLPEGQVPPTEGDPGVVHLRRV